MKKIANRSRHSPPLFLTCHIRVRKKERKKEPRNSASSERARERDRDALAGHSPPAYQYNRWLRASFLCKLFLSFPLPRGLHQFVYLRLDSLFSLYALRSTRERRRRRHRRHYKHIQIRQRLPRTMGRLAPEIYIIMPPSLWLLCTVATASPAGEKERPPPPPPPRVYRELAVPTYGSFAERDRNSLARSLSYSSLFFLFRARVRMVYRDFIDRTQGERAREERYCIFLESFAREATIHLCRFCLFLLLLFFFSHFRETSHSFRACI